MLKFPLKYVILLVCTFLFYGKLSATHIVGGDLTYKYIGNNNYQVELYLYIDCINGSQAAIDQDAFAEIGVFNSSNTLLSSFNLVRTGPSRIVGRNYSCVVPPANACVDLYIFRATQNLPPISGGYQLVFQRCCRNGTIENINNPGGTGSTYRTFIPQATQTGFNSSAKFKGLPPNFLCKDEPLVFDHSATDDDGDQLVYSLCDPLHGASTADPLPIPVYSPPYVTVNWRAPYSVNNQMGGSPMLSINSSTGELVVTPDKVGQFVVGICVKEYRNGVLINTVLRDFQFNVENCVFTVVPQFSVIGGKCQNSVGFSNSSSGGAVAYKWDFGVDSRTDDTSVLKDPIYNFPGPGEYTVTLTAFNANGCSRKITRLVHILPPLTGLLPDSTVCYGSEVKIGVNDNDPKITYIWSPTAGLDNPGISNPTAKVTSDITYKVEKHSVSCYVEGEVNLTIDKINADFVHEYLPPCDGLKVKYFNRSTNFTKLSWDFGDLTTFKDTSTQDSISWFYQDSGIVYVRLDVENEHCRDSFIKPIRIIFPEIFTAEIDTSICFGDAIQIGPLNDTSILSYVWTPTHFMDDANKLYPIVKPDSTLSYTLTKTYAHCTLKDSFIVKVNELPDFGVSRTGGPDICLGDTVQLIASGDPTYQYEWFPKDSLSTPFKAVTLANPSQTTLYRVNVLTTAGCEAEDTVTVHLYPTYLLDLDPNYVVCEGIRFLPDLPIPNATITYHIPDDDVIIDSIDKEGVYTVNVVTQCQNLWDTFRVAHYRNDYCKIEFPNAFSPTGDGLNDTYPFGGLYHDIFGIECLFEDYSLIIFNRWGEIVFRADDPTREWDGRYKENDGNEDVFGYYVTYREYNHCTGSSELKVKWGNVTVLK